MNQSVPFLSVTQATPVQTSRPVRSKTSLVHRAVHQRLRRLLAMFFFFITVPALGQEQLGADIDGEARRDGSGRSVSLSADGRTVAIGAASNDGNGTSSGHTRIFDWDGTAWSQRGADIDGEAVGDRSGSSVSLSSDGNTVAIGAPFNVYGSTSGHTRIFGWDGSAWSQRGADIDGEAAVDQSGYSVSLSADGNTVAIGAPGNDGCGCSGYTRIFDWDGTTWSQRGADIDGEALFDDSGWSVSLSADGNTVAIGAVFNNGNGNGSGHTRIFGWDGSGWRQRGADIDGEAAGDFSGASVALSADGNTVAIGAGGNDGNGDSSGHTRIFDWDGSTWSQRSVDIDGEAAGDYSGSVALSADGNTVAIGATGNDGIMEGTFDDRGHVRVYTYASGCGNPGQDPLAQIADLVAYIEQLNIAKGISNALDVKLDAAARALSDLNAQNDVAAINLMYAFCDNALAQSGKKLEPAEVEELTCRADQIVALLDPQAASCGG